MAGRAPKAAPSKKTNAAWREEAGSEGVAAVSVPNQYASGTDAMASAATRSASDHDAAAVEPVGQRPGEQPEHEVGQALRRRR